MVENLTLAKQSFFMGFKDHPMIKSVIFSKGL